MNNQYLLTGIVVTFDDQEPHSRDEAMAYLEYALKQHRNLKALIIRRKGEDADLEYVLRKPSFERIRRITGYLVGTVDRWNDAKNAELKDRVMHDEST